MCPLAPRRQQRLPAPPRPYPTPVTLLLYFLPPFAFQLDFPKLLKRVDEGYRTWRKPSLCLFGSSDPFVDVATVFEFLETKRTNMKCLTMPAKLGHMPQVGAGHTLARRSTGRDKVALVVRAGGSGIISFVVVC